MKRSSLLNVSAVTQQIWGLQQGRIQDEDLDKLITKVNLAKVMGEVLVFHGDRFQFSWSPPITDRMTLTLPAHTYLYSTELKCWYHRDLSSANPSGVPAIYQMQLLLMGKA